MTMEKSVSASSVVAKPNINSSNAPEISVSEGETAD